MSWWLLIDLAGHALDFLTGVALPLKMVIERLFELSNMVLSPRWLSVRDAALARSCLCRRRQESQRMCHMSSSAMNWVGVPPHPQ